MTYNRCVGTRYCSNNCPYKVRRFNFLQYSDHRTPSLMLLRNPEVTVRNRGVMEKCTYCVQRVNRGRIEAKKAEVKASQDGKKPEEVQEAFNNVLNDVRTACEQACPTNAIVFGNIADKNSVAFQLKQNPVNYGVLEELNTRPRTTYLARMVNPNRPRNDKDLPPLKDGPDHTQGGAGMG
jgi:molybdopterin-containing oxidoreductase family iron-sulfur binding subunit